MKRFVTIMVAGLFGLITCGLTACNTTKGVGQDIEKGGAALKNSAEKHGAD